MLLPNSWALSDEYQKLDDLDIITTVAAGNSGQSYDTDGINQLAASDSLIAVSAVDKHNEFTSFTQKHGELTDISALGQDVPINGSSINKAYQLSPNSNQIVITDTLGSSDEKDYYSFTLDNTANVSIDLTDLKGDVDLFLKDSTNKTLAHEWECGNADLSISNLLSAGEEYFIVTDSYDKKSTEYKLSINFNGGINTDTPNEPAGYASINIENSVNYFIEHIADYAVV